MTAGRIVGSAISTTQGIWEGAQGLGMVGGGIIACGTGIGCAATPVVTPIGAAVTAHGALLASNSVGNLVDNIMTMASKSSGGSSSSDFKRLSSGEIKILKEAGYNPHDLKPSKHGSRFDIFKDVDGELYVLPKNGSGPGDPLGINIYDLGG